MKKLMMIAVILLGSIFSFEAKASNIYDLIGETIDGCQIVDVKPKNSTEEDYVINCIMKDMKGNIQLKYWYLSASYMKVKPEKILKKLYTEEKSK